MAIPNDLFRVKFGVALMRYDYAASEWHFVCWATKTAVVMDLPAGNHAFALWLIIGDLSGPAFVEYEGWSSIYALRARR